MKIKIIIIRLGRIGDMILSTPIFFHLRSSYPNATIDVLGSRHNISILENNPSIDNTFVYDKSPLSFLKLASSLRANSYDILIEPKDHHSTESKLLSKMIKAKKSIGFNSNNNFTFDIDTSLFSEGKLSFLESNLASLEALSIDVDYKSKPILFLNNDELNFFENLKLKPKSYFVLNPSASRKSKTFSNELILQLIKILQSFNLELILISSPEDSDRVSQIADECNCSFVKTKSIRQTFPLIKESKLVISADTSIVHIASSFNVPLIGIYKKNENELEKFKPLSEKYSIVFAEEGEFLESINSNEFDNTLKSFIS